MIEQVGGFNERYHMYSEDTEWCWRIRQKNWRLVFVPEAILLHYGAQSSGKRWTPADQIRVRMNAGFNFERQVLPRWRLTANQLANCLVGTVQVTGRKLLRIHNPDLDVIMEMHREHLKQALSNNGNSHGS